MAKLSELSPNSAIRHLAIGVFDGVHLGHQQIIRETLKDLAHATEAAVLTFDPHPLEFISPELAPPRLTTTEQKIKRLNLAGIDQVIVLEFDETLRQTDPDTFVNELHRLFPHLVEVIVGPDWGFGRGRTGNADTIRYAGLVHGFFTRSLKPVKFHSLAISSTRIREAIVARKFVEAREMLGYDYAVEGTVVSGDQRGRSLGFPTINLTDLKQLMPPIGVYAGKVEVDGQSRGAVMNYGLRPTVGDQTTPHLEAHLLDFQGDLYGKKVVISQFSFIREERKLASLEELKVQITQDIDQARRILAQ